MGEGPITGANDGKMGRPAWSGQDDPRAPGRVFMALNGLKVRRFHPSLVRRLRIAAEQEGFAPEIGISQSLEHMGELITAAIDGGTRLIVVGGGDGTLHHVLNHPRIHEVTISLLPVGTTNTFLRTTRVPLDNPVKVLRWTLRGHVLEGHCGLLNGRRFACFASWGFDARVVHRNPDRLKELLGPASYGLTGLAKWLTAPSWQVPGRLRLDRQPAGRPTSVIVSKIQNYAGATAFRATPFDPHFDVLAAPNDGRATLLAMAGAIATGAPRREWKLRSGVEYAPGVGVIEWRGSQPTLVQLDGERHATWTTRDIRVEIDPVPQSYLMPMGGLRE